nr:MAG TPA: hypothetical protein [Caudoviricetes sp.]
MDQHFYPLKITIALKNDIDNHSHPCRIITRQTLCSYKKTKYTHCCPQHYTLFLLLKFYIH